MVHEVYLRMWLLRTQSQATKTKKQWEKNEKEDKERDGLDIPESSQRVKRHGNAQRVRICRRAMICQNHTGQVL